MCEVLTRGHVYMAQAPKGATLAILRKMQGTGPKGGRNLPREGWEGGEQSIARLSNKKSEYRLFSPLYPVPW